MTKSIEEQVSDYENIKKRFKYDPITGLLTWSTNRYSNLVGKEVGTVNFWGYRVVSVKLSSGWRRFAAHRIAWILTHKEWPKDQIDHINGVKTDNRIINLREVTNRENQHNTIKHRSGKTLGAIYNKSNKNWLSMININKNKIYLGRYKNAELANKAYLAALKNKNMFNGNNSDFRKIVADQMLKEMGIK